MAHRITKMVEPWEKARKREEVTEDSRRRRKRLAKRMKAFNLTPPEQGAQTSVWITRLMLWVIFGLPLLAGGPHPIVTHAVVCRWRVFQKRLEDGLGLGSLHRLPGWRAWGRLSGR